jgi:hypothetical protein
MESLGDTDTTLILMLLIDTTFEILIVFLLVFNSVSESSKYIITAGSFLNKAEHMKFVEKKILRKTINLIKLKLCEIEAIKVSYH